MRLQTKSPDRGSTRSPSRTASRGSLARPLRGRETPLRPARRAVRRRDDRPGHSRLRPAPTPRSGRPERETPRIPLALHGMRGAPRRSARSFFLLPLVLALLALLVVPVFANAGEVPTYETEETP